jgi:RNA polymerase-binding transcription factor DksA
MATKKKGATKGIPKKSASKTKVTSARKTAQPVAHKATTKKNVKKSALTAEKHNVAKPISSKKDLPTASKSISKQTQLKVLKSSTDNSKKAGTAKASKKTETRPVEVAPEQQSTPPPFKTVPKKNVPEVKPSKVAMPDIKTKTVRKYEPDFTKSVLDTPMHDQSGPSQRYSDSELMEFRDLINKKLEAAKKELNYLQGLITRKDEMGGDESDNRYMTMEDGSISMEREQLSQMASRQITFIDHLEKAIMRIENKTYGICRVSGKLIDKARLRAVPHATLSIEAKQTMNM